MNSGLDAEASASSSTHSETTKRPHRQSWKLLALGALGVVYGDIGTSPLYAVRECFHGSHPLPVNSTNVLGVLSLIFWALTLVVSVKYLVFILRADNHGEGGILALTVLLAPMGKGVAKRSWVVVLGLFGAAFLYADGMITPAISVLSAVEGLRLAAPIFNAYLVEAIAVGILIGLFRLQSRGAAGIGAMFGPTMLAWFLLLASLGTWHIAQMPSVLEAIDPSIFAGARETYPVTSHAALRHIRTVAANSVPDSTLAAPSSPSKVREAFRGRVRRCPRSRP